MKDRLQFRYDSHVYRNIDEIKAVLEREKTENLMNWALKSEPIVFYYGNNEKPEKAVLAIGLDGNGNGVTGQSTNDYFLIDFDTLEKNLDEVSGHTGDSIELISGLTGVIENIIEAVGLDEDGKFDWHRLEPTHDDIMHSYPEAKDTDVHHLLRLMIDDIKGNLNENLSLDFDGADIILSNNGEPVATLSANEFVKDGILDYVDIINNESERNRDPEGHDTPVPYILFVWNSDANKSYSRIQLGTIFNPYTNGDGLNLEGNEFSIKIDENNSEFLSVERGGLKVTGVTEAIREAAAAATTKVEHDSHNTHVTVESRDEADGSKTYTVVEDDIASDSDLQEEISTRTQNETNLNSLISNVERNLNTEISERENLTNILEQSALTISSRVDTLSADTHDMERDIETLSAYTIGNVNQLANNDTLMAQDINDLSDEIDAAKDRIEDLEQDGVLGVDPSDKMLTIANNLIAATFNVEYDAELKQIKFFGKNSSLLGTVNTSDFVIDGMINSVSVVEEGGVKYLRFVFNTDAGKQDIDIELTDLVTEYTVAQDSQSFLYIDGFEIGAKVNTTDNTGLATEYQLHALEDIVGDGFNTETEQHTLTQKIRHIEETLEAMPTAEELDEAMEDIQKIKDVLSVQLRTRTVEPTASVKLSFFGAPASDYIKVGTTIQPVVNVFYTDGKYIAANGSETLAGCEVNSNSEKYLKLNGETIGTLTINQDSPSITIQDGEYSAAAHVVYLEGSTEPLDAFGEPNESIRIHAGSIDCETEKVIKAYRPIYYGPFDPDNYAEINATTIANMISGGEFVELPKYSWGEKEYITVQDGTKAFAVIVPSDNDRFVGGEIRAILDNKDHGFNIIDQFDKFNLPNVRTYTGDNTGYAYVAYVYQPATEMEESYFKVIY